MEKVFSFGGGVQSMACLVLAAQGRIDYKTFVFSNVGADSENPGTIVYFDEIVKPYAKKHGLIMIETQWTGKVGAKKGKNRTIYQDLLDATKSIDIPVRLQSGAFGNRNCTARYKIGPLARWTAEQGATAESPWLLGLGISWDESQRMAKSQTPWHINDYPLIATRTTRAQCKDIIIEAGLLVPPKSSCWFCPFKGARDWQALKREQPELFAKAMALENILNERRKALGLDEVYIGPGYALSQISDDVQLSLLFQGCDSGHCWT